MKIKLKTSRSAGNNGPILFLASKKTNWKKLGLRKNEIEYLQQQIKKQEHLITLYREQVPVMVHLSEQFEKKNAFAKKEAYRELGYKICGKLNAGKFASIQINADEPDADVLAVAEGCALSNYQFLRYKTDKKEHTLNSIEIGSEQVKTADVATLNTLINAVFRTRDLVNEPQSFLNASTFADQMKQMGAEAGFKVEVLNKKQIEALKMGGLLSVNKGSQQPPTFTIMEYKPAGAKNKNPMVLVGKGVVYDTGGLSLKPTPNSMDYMKCDMAGGALVAGTMYAVAAAKLPYYLIGLVPATDNRPGEDAYTPGDVITMYDGQTVEVLNTDAEGRLLLGDALAYAKKYKPELVLDFATLTGAAAAAIGPFGIVCMGTADEDTKRALRESGDNVHERLAEFPFWDDYAELIKSDIADMKNIGGPIAGAITAGKFLEKFIDYNWMHFDIAGPAFISKPDSYRGKNATGTGVRFLFDFISQLSK